MADRDYYEVLGVPRGSSPEEIKAAFRRMAALHHPDKNPNDPTAAERFKELNTAYQVLGDQNRRAMYDRFGHKAESPGSPFGAGGPFQGGVVDINDLNLDGMLGDLLGAFGFGKGDKGDIKHVVDVTFEEAAFGCEKEVTYERVVTCVDCNGSGAAPDARLETCKECGGRGRQRMQQGFIPIAVERSCAACRGRGKIPSAPCKSCKGSSLTAEKHTLKVQIPAGVDSGEVKLVRGAGNRPRADRAAGDLELDVHVGEHAFFRRDGDDVLCTVPVTFPQATLGAEVDVPTLDGRGKLRVPPGTQSGTVLRIRGKGIPRRAGMGRGDALVEVKLEIPTQLTDAQRELVEALAKELGEEVQPFQRTFVEKLKALFGA